MFGVFGAFDCRGGGGGTRARGLAGAGAGGRLRNYGQLRHRVIFRVRRTRTPSPNSELSRTNVPLRRKKPVASSGALVIIGKDDNCDDVLGVLNK